MVNATITKEVEDIMLSKLQSIKMSIAIAFTSFIPFLELRNSTYANFSDVFFLIILVLPLAFSVKWHISDWKYGDKWFIISPPIVNLAFLINDLIYSFENNIEIFTSIYFEMVQITFVSYIIIYFIFMTLPKLSWSLYLEPYHHIWYTLTMVQASFAGLISSDYIFDFSIISLIVLIIIILFEKHKINQIEQIIVNQLALNKKVDLYDTKNVSWNRFFNPIK